MHDTKQIKPVLYIGQTLHTCVCVCVLLNSNNIIAQYQISATISNLHNNSYIKAKLIKVNVHTAKIQIR